MDVFRFDTLNRRLSRRAALGTAFAGVAAGTIHPAVAAPATPGATPAETALAIQVRGHVATPLTLTLADLQALPTETADVTFRLTDGTQAHHRYTGARLWDALQLAKPIVDPAHTESALRLYLVLTARDGYVVVLSLGEVDPEFGGRPDLLAWAEDGQALTGPHAPAMLVPPGDRTEGRYIFGLATIDVRTID